MLLPQAGRAVLLQALSGLVGLLPPHASRTVDIQEVSTESSPAWERVP